MSRVGLWTSLSVVAVGPASTVQRLASLQYLDPACQVRNMNGNVVVSVVHNPTFYKSVAFQTFY